jgi:hypothetical protein
MSVYFLECSGRIKIGHSANVKARMQQLTTGAPLELKLIATIDGDYRLELAIQRHLKPYRVKGEWFDDCGAVRSVIDGLVANGPAAIGYIAEEQSPRREPSQVQAAITSLIKQKRPYGTKAWELISALTGLGERSAKLRLSNTSSYSIEEVQALIRSDDGLDFLQVIMADAKPEWWKPVRRTLARR